MNQSDSDGGGKKGVAIRYIYTYIPIYFNEETEPIGYIDDTWKALSRLRRSPIGCRQ